MLGLVQYFHFSLSADTYCWYWNLIYVYVIYMLTRHITQGIGSSGSSGDGSAATSASLYYPNGVALDSTGNLYIVDSFNNRIRKVSTTGVITTIAGTEHAVAVCLVPCQSFFSV